MRTSKDLVLIADRIENHNHSQISSTTLEFVEDEYFQALSDTMQSINSNFIHYQSPYIFLENIAKHKNSIVLSVWSGEKSRNRKALVPSICEAYNIPYVGADSYLHIISADKHLSKKICLPFGVEGAKDIVISSEKQFAFLHTLSYPVVIKPNLEGGSIGIFQDNVVYNVSDAKKICLRLLQHFNPLIVEEYLPGEEVSICIAGIKGEIDIFQIMAQSIGGKSFFTSEILGAEVKKIDKTQRRIEPKNNILPPDEIDKIISLYNSFGKAEIMRIDGRVKDNHFKLIELTPDCSLNIHGSVSQAFKNCGYSYKNAIEYLLNNAVSSWEDQNANK